MSRRRSMSTPDARSGGPVTPSAIASSAERWPTPFSRLAKDRIAGEQIRILVDLFGKGLDEGLHAVEEIERRLHGEAADAEVAGHHALAGYGLKEAQNIFALAEGVEEDGQRANVHGVRAQPDQVRIQARELGEQHADPLRASREFQGRAASRRPGSSRDCWPCGPR